MENTTGFVMRSAVILLMFRKVDGVRQTLLQHRKNVEVLDNLWDAAASGRVEKDESMRQAMCREAREELGIDIAPDDLRFRAMGNVLVRSGYTYVNGYFEATRWRGEPAIMEPDKCDDLRWFPVNALPADMIPERRRAVLDAGDEVHYYEEGFAPDAIND